MDQDLNVTGIRRGVSSGSRSADSRAAPPTAFTVVVPPSVTWRRVIASWSVVRRRAVHPDEANTEQPEIHAELRAMVDQVAHHDVPNERAWRASSSAVDDAGVTGTRCVTSISSVVRIDTPRSGMSATCVASSPSVRDRSCGRQATEPSKNDARRRVQRTYRGYVVFAPFARARSRSRVANGSASDVTARTSPSGSMIHP